MFIDSTIPRGIYMILIGHHHYKRRSSHSSHAGPERYGNFAHTLNYFADFLTMIFFTAKLVVNLKCNYGDEFRKTRRC